MGGATIGPDSPRVVPEACAAPDLRAVRCPGCRRKLARLRLGPGSTVEIKCGGCNRFATVVPPGPER